MAEEREVKLAVDDGFRLPGLDGAVGLHAADRGVRILEATYWDSPELDLVRNGVGLRYRTTDGGAGTWTLKANGRRDGAAVVRDETDVPGDPEQPPEAVRALLPAGLGAARLEPVARLRTRRHVVDLVDADGSRWAEVADDDVTVLDGGHTASRFREVEVEITGPPDEGRTGEVLSRLRAAGARETTSPSKYVRALRALGRDPAA